MKKNNLPSFVYDAPIYDDSQADVWLFSLFSLQRNLNKQTFPHKMKEMQLQHTRDLFTNSFHALFNEIEIISIDELKSLEKEFVAEMFFNPEIFQENRSGRTLLIDPETKLFAFINFNDHLSFQMLESHKKWNESWDTLTNCETKLSELLPFAFSNKFGYLTSDLEKCGTGLSVKAALHLPALTAKGKIQEALEKELDETLISTTDEFLCDLVFIHNRYSIGLTEEQILHSVYSSANNLSIVEKALRSNILKTEDPETKDKVSRAFGLLSHSYQLETKEAIEAVSLVKLGIDLGWITNVSSKTALEVFFKCRRANLLLTHSDEDIEKEKVGHLRAQYLHKSFEDAKLII